MLTAFHTRDAFLVKVNGRVQHNTDQNLLRQELLNPSSREGVKAGLAITEFLLLAFAPYAQ